MERKPIATATAPPRHTLAIDCSTLPTTCPDDPGSAGAAFSTLMPGQPVTTLWNPSPAGTTPHHLDLFAVNKDRVVISTYFGQDKWLGGWFAPCELTHRGHREKADRHGVRVLGQPGPSPHLRREPRSCGRGHALGGAEPMDGVVSALKQASPTSFISLRGKCSGRASLWVDMQVKGVVIVAIRRSKRIRGLAASRGWLWQKHDESLVRAFIGYPFGIGRGARTDDVMRGRFQGREVLLFDLGFQTGSGDDERAWWIGIYCVADLPRALPVLESVRRGWTRPGPSPGIGTEYKTGDREFDRRYRVTAQNHASAAAVLSPAFISFLKASPPLDWRIEGTRMLTWGPHAMRPKHVEGVLSCLVDLASAIPEEVWQR